MNTQIRTRHLPHWDVPGSTYFITSCLAGSIPAKGLLDIVKYRNELARSERPQETPAPEWEYLREKMAFARTELWLDSSPAVRHLADSQLAQVVVDSIFHFAGERYELLAYVVMPSHFHWVFRPTEEWVTSLGRTVAKRPPRERIMHTLKTHTGLECNKLLSRRGMFWQDESYDHCVRDEAELFRIIEYVENNPVKAGFVRDPDGWEFSSSRLRTQFGIQYGERIPKIILAQAAPLSQV
jgi:type I restriction enzyme R subunit